ncbi:MAG: DUF3782 domain-containing protein [Aigarchaeota archaeon]|nr:DUF3782 domain-containing protein [Candidatus Calditenuis fumarioli]
MAARERLKSRILKLLREDEEFRYAVAGLIGLDEILKRLDRHESHIIEILKRLDRHEQEIARLREDMNRLREDMIRGFERHDKEIAKLREDMNRLREDMNKGFEAVNRQISALGARWGLMSEEAFREGLKGILEKELGLKVERWTAFDEGGEVFGFPSPVEVDVAVKDGKTLLIEVSSQVRPSDVVTLYRKAKLYERKTGKRPDRLIFVTPFATDNAVKTAMELGVEIYTRV